MQYKKIMILTIILTCLLTISTVSATDNATDDVVSADETTRNIVSEVDSNNYELTNQNDVVETSSEYFDNLSYTGGTLSSIEDEVISFEKEDYLNAPLTYNDYAVWFDHDITIDYGSNDSIFMDISSKRLMDEGIITEYDDFSFDFYLKVYNSHGVEKISKRYYNPDKFTGIVYLTYDVKSTDLIPGVYTLKILNTYDNHVMDTAKLTIKSVPYSAYSVSIVDTSMVSESGGSITMSISPSASDYYYKYDFYLKGYDPYGFERINQRYCGTTSSSQVIYNIESNTLVPGVHTIRIFNTYDDKVMATAKLTVYSQNSFDYSVSIQDTSLYYGENGQIFMSISPNGVENSYKYDFYLKVYDSNNTEKFSKNYNGESNHAISLSYTISNQFLVPGVYTIKVIRTEDGGVLKNAKLTVKSVPYSAYSVSVQDISIDYESSGTITMSISPASGYYYKYDFYLKVYDSNNTEKISKRYSSANSYTSEKYNVGSTTLTPAVYTIKIFNSDDNHVMDTAKLTVKSVPYSAYSVSVSDTSVNYGSSGTIAMSISPASGYYYKYDFYLKVYDSNNTEKISKRYYNSAASSKVTYSISSTQLDPGNYTIKLLNFADNHVMDTAKLTVKSVPYSAYSVSVSDTSLNYGVSGTISMNISSASNYYYKYDFYLKVYDSTGFEIFSERYASTNSFSRITFNVVSNTLNTGEYTIKIINAYDNYVMDTAKLTVMSLSSSSAYSVSIQNDELVYYQDNETITMTISPSSFNNPYKYDFFLKVIHIQTGLCVIYERYRSDTILDCSKIITYTIDCNSLQPGDYLISIFKVEDGQLMKETWLNDFEVIEFIPTIITVDVSTDFKENHYLIITLKDYSGNAVSGAKLRTDFMHEKLNIDDSQLHIEENTIILGTTDENGQVKLRMLDLNPGHYSLWLRFWGNDLYYHSSNYMGVTIPRVPTQIYATPQVSTVYNGGKFIYVTLKDCNGNLIEDPYCWWNISLDDYELWFISDGKLKIPTDGLAPGNYSVRISFENDYYDQSSTNVEIVVSKATPVIIANQKNFEPTVKTKKYSITLKNNKKVLKNTKVTLKVNGKKYYATTNSKGVATFTLTKLTKKGTYKATITYAATKNYNKATKQVTITVKPTPKITAKKATFKVKTKTKKYTITLKNNKNKVMKKTKVSLKVNGKTYKATTNNKGQATFKITKLTKKGTFKATISYAGNKNYNKATKTVNFKVK